MGVRESQARSAEMEECIRNCTDCHSICLETISYCLQMSGEHAEPAHIRVLMDCAEICQTSANFMLRESTFHGLTCGVCAQVCEQCATSCARFDDAQLTACAEMCQRCAASCHTMEAMAM
ncbi:MAG: four-helix bundle copper-binding protein [Anaerolineae bacterium]